jgi:hypothetical protein
MESGVAKPKRTMPSRQMSSSLPFGKIILLCSLFPLQLNSFSFRFCFVCLLESTPSAKLRVFVAFQVDNKN